MITRADAAVSIHKLYKYVVNEESILTVVLKGQLLIENQIETLLNIVLVEPSVFDWDRMYLPQKLDLLVAIGVFSESDMIAYRKFNRIRSKFAHNLEYELTDEDLKSIVNSFNPKISLFFLKKDYDQEEDIIKKLKYLIIPLLSLIIFQSAQDEEGLKTPNDYTDIADIERAKKKGRENINNQNYV